MAEEFVKNAYEKLQKTFDGNIVIGIKKSNGNIEYSFFPHAISTSDIEHGILPEIVYAGRIKIYETEKGLIPNLTDVEISEVKTELNKEKEKIEKFMKEAKNTVYMDCWAGSFYIDKNGIHKRY